MTIVDIAHSHQGLLETVVHRLFPGEKVVVNSRKETDLVNPGTGAFLELDIFLPKHNISFEFQDAYHYVTTWYSQLALHEIKQVDARKRDALRTRDGTLVIVPCWWDGTNKSLASTVAFARPDVFSLAPNESSLPIPLNPPLGIFDVGSDLKIPNVGELMLASFPPFQFHHSISKLHSWWIGEKFDGIRFCWNPVTRKLYRRAGIELDLPTSFLRWFGASFLDGEIWFGKSSFFEAQKLVRCDLSLNWAMLRAIAFDRPDPTATKLPFEKRYRLFLAYVLFDHPFLTNAARFLCESRAVLVKMMKKIVKERGEGVILRKPGSLYTRGRSLDLFKYKAGGADTEGLVIDLGESTATLQMPNGVIVEAENKNPKNKNMKPGDVVTFSYGSDSTSKFSAKVLRIRFDLSWFDVVKGFGVDPTLFKGQWNDKWMNTKSSVHGAVQAQKDVKVFFENFAKRNRFDPLVPENWYTTTKQLWLEPDVKSVVVKFKGSIVRALLHVFPNIGLEINKFSFLPQKYWLDPANRRKFLDNFARSRDMDPLKLETWHILQNDQSLIKNKNMASLLTYYKGGIGNAIQHLYPDLSFTQKIRFALPHNYWKDPKTRRDFFEKFAKEKRLGDPLSAETWYPLTSDLVKEEKYGKSILHYYNDSLVGALVDVFPEISFDIPKFRGIPQNYWHNAENRANLFKMIARQQGFDPLVPNNWYSISPKLLKSHKGVQAVLNFYNGNLPTALKELFPNIGLEINNFPTSPHKFWQDKTNRKAFFLNFAKEHKFDPLLPGNWYKVPISLIRAHKQSGSVRSYYKGSVTKALMDLFPDIGLNTAHFKRL